MTDPLKEPCHDCRMPSEGWENGAHIRFCVQCAVRWRDCNGEAIDFSGDSVDVDRRYYLAQWGATAKRERAVREQLNTTLEAAHQIEGALRDALTWMGQTNDGDTEERRRILAAGWAALEGR